MGMDLITTGLTTHSGTPDPATIEAIIAELTDAWIEDNIEIIDTAGWIEATGDEADLGTPTRDALTAGADAYLTQTMGRNASSWDIPGTPLTFHVMGGSSWGDSPFDGFDELCIFAEACGLLPELREAAFIVCWGIPSARVIATYAE
jgi:hypothetical protein